MTLKNNRAPLLPYFKLCASFRSHWRWVPGQENLTTRFVTRPRGVACRGGRGFLVLLPNTSFQPSTSRSTPIHAWLNLLMIIIQSSKMGAPGESQMLLAQLLAWFRHFHKLIQITHTVKMNQPVCISIASAGSKVEKRDTWRPPTYSNKYNCTISASNQVHYTWSPARQAEKPTLTLWGEYKNEGVDL